MKISLCPMAIGPYLRPLQGEVMDSSMPEAALDTVKSALTKVSNMGYDGIETATPSVFSCPQEFRDFMDSINLEVLTCGGLTYDELKFGDLKDKIAECKTLGAKNVMIGQMPHECAGNYDELLAFCRALNRAGKILADEGIALSYHNHACDFAKVNGQSHLQIILDNTCDKSVFFELDTHWLQSGGAHVFSWIKKTAGRVRFIHFKDYGIDEYSDTNWLECTHKLWMEIGQGNLNWPGIIEACKEAKIEWCSVEQDVVRRPGFEASKISVDYLHSLGIGAKR